MNLHEVGLAPCHFSLFSIKHQWKTMKWKNRRASPHESYYPTPIEKWANVITHGLWVIPSIFLTHDLIKRSTNQDQRISALVYGASFVLSFGISTIFHLSSFWRLNRVKTLLHYCDRACIYIFIVGSYFPWLTLGKISESKCMFLAKTANFVLSFMGIVYQQKFHERYKNLEMALYVAVGVGPGAFLMSQHDFPGQAELAFGGVFYITGLVFFKCDGLIPCAHAIWHIFTVAGAAVHYSAIRTYLYPI